MLTARNVIGAVIVIAAISLVSACYSLLRPREGSALAGDSYGTRAHGQRALYEVLTELGLPVERLVVPPTAIGDRQATLVFWKPNSGLVALEPAYLEKISEWVRAGGRVVVCPDRVSKWNVVSAMQSGQLKSLGGTILEQLGLPDVKLRSIDLTDDEAVAGDEKEGAQRERGALARRRYDPDRPVSEDLAEIRDLLTGAYARITTRSVEAKLTGTLADWQNGIRTLELPEIDVQVIADAGPGATGTITFDDGGTERILAASYSVGEGRVIVVGLAAIAENRSLASDDNSVLAVRLLAEPGRPVVFDEFYHGLTIRGNPLWLFTRPGYSTATISLLALVGLLVWRQGVFLGPPLVAAQKSRRAIGAYVEAMARFLSRGAASHRFLLAEVRSGVLHTIRQELRLPPGREEVEELAAVIARREPARAKRLVEAVAQLDTALARGGSCREQDTIRLIREVTLCL